ncbi:MAG: hypothetical protein GC136_03145 [Alphaproteobacteria bacterium]|nr:hypothetical protein [Alphaproteobacteria bacterium]
MGQVVRLQEFHAASRGEEQADQSAQISIPVIDIKAAKAKRLEKLYPPAKAPAAPAAYFTELEIQRVRDLYARLRVAGVAQVGRSDAANFYMTWSRPEGLDSIKFKKFAEKGRDIYELSRNGHIVSSGPNFDKVFAAARDEGLAYHALNARSRGVQNSALRIVS